MASKGDIEREKRIRKTIAKYRDIREELKSKVRNVSLKPQDRVKAMLDLNKLPRDGSYIRARNRCSVDGRSRSYMRNFGLGRHRFRELASEGLIPGVKKASW